jgi:hypothetical protein
MDRVLYFQHQAVLVDTPLAIVVMAASSKILKPDIPLQIQGSLPFLLLFPASQLSYIKSYNTLVLVSCSLVAQLLFAGVSTPNSKTYYTSPGIVSFGKQSTS